MPESLTNENDLYRQRLLIVARALRESPHPDRFTMGDVINDCGTPGCAFGHYVCRTDLQSDMRPVRTDIGTWTAEFTNGTPAIFFGKEVRQYFGLDVGEQGELFDASGCGGARTPNEAAQYVEEFVARKYPLTALDQLGEKR